MTTAFKYPDCPKGFIACGFKRGEITTCDKSCNDLVSTEPCGHCHMNPAECTVYGVRVCYDCAAVVYEAKTGTSIN